MNIVLAEVRKAVMGKHNPVENDLYKQTLELAQIDEDEYFDRVVHDDWGKIIVDHFESELHRLNDPRQEGCSCTPDRSCKAVLSDGLFSVSQRGEARSISI